MDSTIRFNASNMSINLLGRGSNCSWGHSSLILKNSIIPHDFRHISTIRNNIAKRRIPVDSACQIGLNTLLKEVPTVGEVSVDGDLKFAILGTVLLTSGEPVEIQRNGWPHSI